MNSHFKKYSLCLLLLLTGCATNIDYEDALYYLSGNDYNNAIPKLKLALQEEPLNKEMRHQLASCYMSTKRLTDAKKEYQTILSIDPNDTAAKSQIEKIVSTNLTKGKELLQKEEYQQAYSTFNDVLDVDVENKEALESIKGMLDKFLELGDKSFEEEDYADASKNYGIALEIDPTTAEILKDKLNRIRAIYEEKGDKTKNTDAYAAVDQFNIAIAVDPKNSALHFKVANIYSFFSDFNHYAFWSYTKAIAIAPLKSKYHAYFGELYYKKLDFKRADKEYLYSLKLIEKEIEEKRYNKAAYKYYYDSIKPLERWIKEIEGKDGLYIYAGDENNKETNKRIETKLDLTNDHIKLFKHAKEFSDTISKVFSLLKESKAEDNAKLDILKEYTFLLDLFSKDNEDLTKEKESYDSIVSKFDKIGITSNEHLIKLGSFIKRG